MCIVYSKCILSKLHIKENEIGVVATWDSSAHGNSKLNRVTPDHEKLYMIVKVLVRLTDPSPMGNIFDNFVNKKLIRLSQTLCSARGYV